MSEDDIWLRNRASGFGTATPEDEYYHGRNGVEGDSLTETWYWNFAVPEAGINVHLYCWVHPNLDVVTSGLFAYRGLKRQNLASELFDVHSFLSIKVIGGSGSDIQIPNGLRVRVIEPLQRIHIAFADPARGVDIDVQLRAVADVIMRSNNKHFEQLMHCTGRMVLRGEHFDIDCYKVRDRSWGELRPEGNSHLPAYTWLTGAFGADFAFNMCAHDDPTEDASAAKAFPVPKDQLFKDGWVWRDGRKIRLKHGSKHTERDPLLLFPLRHRIEMEDVEGQRYRMQGEIISSLPWTAWANHVCHLAQARWTLADGRIGYGESQDGQWNDYVYAYSPKR
jgi:hypothetical protein